MKAADSSKTSASKRPQCTTPQKPTLTFAVARSFVTQLSYMSEMSINLTSS